MFKYNNLNFEPLVDPTKDYEKTVCDAMETTLKFGRFKGCTLHTMVLSSSGRSYLKWMSSDESTFKDHMKEKVKVVLVFAEKQLAEKGLYVGAEKGIDIREIFGNGKQKKTEL